MSEKNTGSAYISRSCLFLVHITICDLQRFFATYTILQRTKQSPLSNERESITYFEISDKSFSKSLIGVCGRRSSFLEVAHLQKPFFLVFLVLLYKDIWWEPHFYHLPTSRHLMQFNFFCGCLYLRIENCNICSLNGKTKKGNLQ